MEQAADIARGEEAGEAVAEPRRSRPILSLSGSPAMAAPERVDGVAEEAPVTHERVRDPSLDADRMDEDRTVPDRIEPAASGNGPLDAAKPEATSPASEDAEHEAVAIARKAKEGEEASQDAAPPVQGDGVDGADPVAAAIADAATGADPVEPSAGAVSIEVATPVQETGAEPKREMDYHEALSHINRTSARRGHVDIDERITEYVRTNRRDVLDRPAPSTVKRERLAQRNGTVDERLAEARRIVAGGISSKDISVQVAIDQMEARRGRKGAEEIRSLTKGPAVGVDPSVAAAKKAKASPGL